MEKSELERVRAGLNHALNKKPRNPILIDFSHALVEIERLRNALDKFKLLDKFGVEITDGCVVHWTDGGDDLSIQERILTRWDRIAVTSRGAETTFKVIDSPHGATRNGRYKFNLGSFIWSDTAKYLTVVAENEADYRSKFKHASECMAYVLEKSPTKGDGQ